MYSSYQPCYNSTNPETKQTFCNQELQFKSITAQRLGILVGRGSRCKLITSNDVHAFQLFKTTDHPCENYTGTVRSSRDHQRYERRGAMRSRYKGYTPLVLNKTFRPEGPKKNVAPNCSETFKNNVFGEI